MLRSVHLGTCNGRMGRKGLGGMGVVEKISIVFYCKELTSQGKPASMPKCLQQNRTATAAPVQLREEQWSLLTKVMPSAAAETFTEPWHEGHPAPWCTLTRCSCSFTGKEMGHVKPLVVEMHPIHYHGNRWKHQDLSYKPRCKCAGGKQVCYWPKLRITTSVINFHIFCPGDSRDAPWRNPTAQLAQCWLGCTSNVPAST